MGELWNQLRRVVNTHPYLFLLAIGLTTRILLIGLVTYPTYVPDSYDVLAQNLFNHGTLSYHPEGLVPTVSRGPVHPLFLAPISSALNPPTWWARLYAMLPGLFAVLLLYSYTVRRIDANVALWAAAFAAIYPVEFHFSAYFCPTGLPALLIVSIFLLADHLVRCPTFSWPKSIALGLLAGTLILARQEMVIVVALVLIIIVYKSGSMQIVLRFLVSLTIAILLITPWSIRSSRLAETFVGVHVLAGFNFWIGEDYLSHPLPEHKGEAMIRGRQALFSRLPNRLQNDQLSYKMWSPRQEAEVDHILIQDAFARILSEPFDYLGRVLTGIPFYFFGAETRSKTILAALIQIPLWLLAFWSFWVYRRHEHLSILVRFAAGSVLLLCIAHAAIYPIMRYSAVMQPITAFVAALALLDLLHRRYQKRKKT